MPEISVIVPVYQTEKYLPRCLDSILRQSFADWEAICVDDGCSDGCPEILDSYAAADSRFHVVHQKNSGVSESRNRALELAGGKYCLFVDSDDFIHPQLMEICHSFAEKTGSDIVAFTYNHFFYQCIRTCQRLHLPECRISRFPKYDTDKLDFFLTDSIFDYATESSHPGGIPRKWAVKHCQPWRCLYRSAVIADLRFPPDLMFEDMPWWGNVLLNVRKSCILNLPLYYYYHNVSGYVNSSALKYQIDCLDAAVRISENVFKEKAPVSIQEKWEDNFLKYYRQMKIDRENKLLKI